MQAARVHTRMHIYIAHTRMFTYEYKHTKIIHMRTHTHTHTRTQTATHHHILKYVYLLSIFFS